MSIGAVVLAVLLVALVIGAIVGAPDRQTAEASYFRLDFAANSSTSLEPGAPVTFRGSTIGSVVAAEPGETQLRVVIKVDPRDRTIARTDQAYLTTEGGLDYLRYGP
jgi:ABC-type transporter Mla subunit MlaD